MAPKHIAVLSLILLLWPMAALAQTLPDLPHQQVLLNAAKNGEAHAQHRIGYYYHNGYNVSANREEAMLWYKKAANQGLVKSEYAYGYMLGFDKAGSLDYAAALPWMIKAATPRPINQGYGQEISRGWAQEKLEWMCRSGVAEFPSSHALANDPKCLSGRGERLYKGSQKYNIPQDYVAARDYLTRAVEGGDAKAARYLSDIYRYGYGVEANIDKAQSLLLTAADGGDSRANLALARQAERMGDMPLRLEKLHLAAQSSRKTAHRELATIYLQGYGVKPDSERALMHGFIAGQDKFLRGYVIPSTRYNRMREIYLSEDAENRINRAYDRAKIFAQDHQFSKNPQARITHSYGAAMADYKWLQKRGGIVISAQMKWLLLLLSIFAMLGFVPIWRFLKLIGFQWMLRHMDA